jgi:hypothetical protein
MLSLELIDSGLVLARQGADGADIVAEAPGVAVLEEQATYTGAEAARRVRLTPLLAQTNFWRSLSTATLARPSRLIQTTADIAFAQLEPLLRAHRDADEGVLLAVPAGYSREQLGLLLGIVNETGVPVAGLVDAALAACSLASAPPRVLHLDLELHQALLTVLEYSGGERPGLKRSRYEILLQQGLLALQQTWMHFIAEQFVRKTRFDPLHEAANEQRLFDRLPEWLAALASEERIVLAMSFGERTLEIEAERQQFIAAAEPHYAELQRLVQSARVAGMPIELRVSHRVAALPGLLDRFRALKECTVQVAPRGAAAFGALRHEAAIRRPADALALVYQLPVASTESSATSPAEFEATPAPLRPTHVLFQGRAWRLTEQPLVIGWQVEGAARALRLPAAAPGISRAHCTLIRRNGAVLIEDHSTYGSYVNEERVVGRTTLTVGDRLRLGSPGVTLELIQLVNDDGAPQD